jgi:hypothetical protein
MRLGRKRIRRLRGIIEVRIKQEEYEEEEKRMRKVRGKRLNMKGKRKGRT